jgi:hypothetical protein
MSKPAIYRDSGERRYYTPEDIQRNSKKGTIVLYAREAFDNTGIMHYYYVKDGQYVSAFPQNQYPPHGKIIMESGPSVPGSPDFKRSIKVGEITGDAESLDRAFGNIKSVYRKAHMNVDYVGWSTNSNAVAITALYNSGIGFVRGSRYPGSGSDLNAPGQDIDIFEQIRDKSSNKESSIKGLKIDRDDNQNVEITNEPNTVNQTTRASISSVIFGKENKDLDSQVANLVEKINPDGKLSSQQVDKKLQEDKVSREVRLLALIENNLAKEGLSSEESIKDANNIINASKIVSSLSSPVLS